MDKKAQIATTMTWIVATLIIIAVLGISIFAANFVLPGVKPVFLDDKKKDLLATKSITSFLRDDGNTKTLESNNEEAVYNELNALRNTLPKNKVNYLSGSVFEDPWRFEFSSSDLKLLVPKGFLSITSKESVINCFETNILFKGLELKFWKIYPYCI